MKHTVSCVKERKLNSKQSIGSLNFLEISYVFVLVFWSFFFIVELLLHTYIAGLESGLGGRLLINTIGEPFVIILNIDKFTFKTGVLSNHSFAISIMLLQFTVL